MTDDDEKADRSDRRWTTVAIVLLGAGMLVGFTFAGLNRLSISRTQQDQQEQTQQNHEGLCQFAAVIPLPAHDTPYLQELERRIRCPKTVPTPLPTRTVIAPSVSVRVSPQASTPARSSGAAAGSNRQEHPGRTSTTAAPAAPSASPTPTASPRPSMSPTTPPLLCVLRPIVQLGSCP